MTESTSANPLAAKSGNYCPDAGEIIDTNFDPRAGSEQAGPRPALVLSARSYNKRATLCVVVPITGQVKDYPFEVALPLGMKTKGVILSDQVKSMSWEARGARYREKAPASVVDDVKAKIQSLLDIP